MSAMRAYRMIEWGGAPAAVEVPTPEPGPGQFLIRVAGCGLCHSDFAMRRMPEAIGARMGWRMPFTLGHEIAGWIESSPSPEFAVGQAVALAAANSCGKCRLCLDGKDNCCDAGVTGRGFGRDGGLAGFVLVDDARALLPLGRLDPRTAGPLTDAGATALHAVRRGLPRLRDGGTAVVIGAGGLGSFALQYLKHLTGTRVVAVDAKPAQLERAAEFGAQDGLSVDKLPPRSADVVLDFVGTDATIEAGIKAVRPAGAFGLVGAAGGKLDRSWFTSLPRDGEVFTFQGGGLADAREAIALVEQGHVRNDVVRFPFERIEEAYQALAEGTLTGRAVIAPAD